MTATRLGSITLVALGVAGCAAPGARVQLGPAATPRGVTDTVFVVDTVFATPMVSADELRAGRFDNGKMWTFEYPPLDFFREAYQFEPDSAWFHHARLGALRLPNCTASFVSPNGLVLTNHHCVRESVSAVSRDGEGLLDQGFYAMTLEEERAVEDLYVDQLIAIVDLSDEVEAASEGEREQVLERASTRIAGQYGQEDSVVVETILLWHGAKTSAYVFRRFTDVRLVMAPELQMGYFGGDSDNFTFPRYALDMSFYRVYVGGAPYRPDFYFRWSETGVEEGDAVFVIGNPGSSSRLETVAQLEFRRAVSDKATLDFVTSRIAALQAYAAAHPEEAEEMDLRNRIFSLLNAQKAFTGIWQGLHNPVVMARRRDNQKRFRSAIERDSTLRVKYGDLFDRMADIQQRKQRFAAELGAFLALGNPSYTSATLMRGIWAFQYLSARSGGAPEAQLNQIAEQFESVGSQPAELQVELLSARLADLERYFGEESEVVTGILEGRSAQVAAQSIVGASLLSDSAGAIEALTGGMVTDDDPAVEAVTAILPRFSAFQGRLSQLSQEEESVERQLGRAWYDVYGTTEPPDATFSLRIADGLVTPYEYNGTVAPAYTTFWGLYDHYFSYGTGTEWDLPESWLDPPATFDLSTPLNFISTADIIGGNSGSAVLNRDLELVGVAFDGNIESLPGDYIYLPDRNRAISVDARGMLEALEEIYNAERLVQELRSQRR